jgi:hypothetical protein
VKDNFQSRTAPKLILIKFVNIFTMLYQRVSVD